LKKDCRFSCLYRLLLFFYLNCFFSFLFYRPNFSAHHLPERGDGFLERDRPEFITSSQKGAAVGAGGDDGTLTATTTDGLITNQQQQQQQQGDGNLNGNVANPVDFETALQQLSYCETFDCIKEAHTAIGGRSRFNFPHFFLIGWQKCATTSVNLNLRSHPEYLPSPVKESHYFTTCQHFWNHPNCMAHNTSHYIHEFLRLEDAVASKLERVSVDASVDYAWKGGAIAPELYQLFPWIKLVVIMREPLSRLISYVRMYTQREHEVKGCLEGRSMFDCLQYHLGKFRVREGVHIGEKKERKIEIIIFSSFFLYLTFFSFFLSFSLQIPTRRIPIIQFH
jgi:hypothetical protein